MKFSTIKQENYPDWSTFYWTYQYTLAAQYYIPRLQSWDIKIEEKKILDIGCGDGGFTAAFGKAGGYCTGVEIRDFNWKPVENVNYIVQNIYEDSALKKIQGDYDLIILRDVIEHIPISKKETFLKSVMGFSNRETKFLITFPPFYSPFGLHQQTLLKSAARKFPFLSIVPFKLLLLLLRLLKEDNKTIDNINDIRESRMTIHAFNQLIIKLGFKIVEEEYFLIRPSHEIRYGWKMRKFATKPMIGFREFTTLGVCYLLSNANVYSENIG